MLGIWDVPPEIICILKEECIFNGGILSTTSQKYIGTNASLVFFKSCYRSNLL